jgi:hypothetical protein
MKYYCKIMEINLNVENMPNKFPMFIMCTDDIKKKYSMTMMKAMHFGFDPKVRKLCFTLLCKEGYTHEDLFEIMKDLPEITEENYNLIKSIPHWDPIEESLKILERYIDMIDGRIEIMESSAATRKALDGSIDDVKKLREIFINT